MNKKKKKSSFEVLGQNYARLSNKMLLQYNSMEEILFWQWTTCSCRMCNLKFTGT